MLTIQDLGLSIMGDTPKNLYILGGSEYGIKDKYIEMLISKIGKKQEYDSVTDIINFMSRNHIIVPAPQVYVIRYDKGFVSNIKDLAPKLSSIDILGVLVLIYEDDKDITKLDKYFPDNTATINPVGIKMLLKYLKSDFPKLDAKSIEYAAKNSTNYYQAKNICRCLDIIKEKAILSEKQIISLFDIHSEYSNNDIQIAIASRNFYSLMKILDNYDSDPQNILYQILRVMTELDKIQSSKYSNSPLKEYANKWKKADIYYMFNHTYDVIKSLRQGYVADTRDVIIYLAALLMFQNIPDTRLLQ